MIPAKVPTALSLHHLCRCQYCETGEWDPAGVMKTVLISGRVLGTPENSCLRGLKGVGGWQLGCSCDGLGEAVRPGHVGLRVKTRYSLAWPWMDSGKSGAWDQTSWPHSPTRWGQVMAPLLRCGQDRSWEVMPQVRCCQ